MMDQQAQLLEIAGRNALKLLQEEQKKASPAILDAINSELETSKKYDGHDWKTPINKNNFDALHQVEQLWKRTERYVSVLEVPAEQAQLKSAALEMVEKGKKIIHDRLKIIRYADRDGWKAALHFVGDDIAESEAEAKKMRKSKKETEKEREAERSRRERDRRVYSSNREGQGSSRDRSPWGRNNRSQNWGSQTDNRYCFQCTRMGHIARNHMGHIATRMIDASFFLPYMKIRLIYRLLRT